MVDYQEFADGDVYKVKTLCDELMAFQTEQATIFPEIMGEMNFENRLLPDFQDIKDKKMVIAYVNDVPAGFGFATVTKLSEETIKQTPAWAEKLTGLGFYPQNYSGRMIGTFKLLYVAPQFRGLQIGKNICHKIMAWLETKNVDDLWVFVANGNENVGRLYETLGFQYSHSVYNDFIQAYRKKPINIS